MADDESTDTPVVAINVTNDFAVHHGRNLPNHIRTHQGQPTYVRIGNPQAMIFRTNQQVYRFIGHLLKNADLADLADEEGAHDYDDVVTAILESE